MQKSVTGKLKHGMLYQEKRHKDFELKSIESTGQLFDAEIEAGGVENQLAFNGALLSYQLVRVGECTGPFSIAQVRALHPDDFKILRDAQNKLSKLEAQEAVDPNE